MKKALKIIAICLVAALLIIQLFRADFINQPVNATETLQASTTVPETVENILKRSCYDCHSNETVYPWYSYIQPSAWFLAHHIDEGRRELNFSVWNTYETRRKRRKLDQICEQSQEGEMPLPSYLWIHWNAKLSKEDVKILCEWTESESNRLASLP